MNMHPLSSFASSQVFPAEHQCSELSVVNEACELAFASGIVHISRRERPGLQCILGVASDRSNLLRELKHDGLVRRGRVVGRGVLVLGDRLDFRVHRGLGTELRRGADGARITLERTEDQGADHTVDVASGLRVREGLVSNGLLQAGEVLDKMF